MDWDTLLPQITDYGVRIIGVLVALWVAFTLARWVQRKLTGALQARKFDETLSIFFGNVARWLMLIAAIPEPTAMCKLKPK